MAAKKVSRRVTTTCCAEADSSTLTFELGDSSPPSSNGSCSLTPETPASTSVSLVASSSCSSSSLFATSLPPLNSKTPREGRATKLSGQRSLSLRCRPLQFLPELCSLRLRQRGGRSRRPELCLDLGVRRPHGLESGFFVLRVCRQIGGAGGENFDLQKPERTEQQRSGGGRKRLNVAVGSPLPEGCCTWKRGRAPT